LEEVERLIKLVAPSIIPVAHSKPMSTHSPPKQVNQPVMNPVTESLKKSPESPKPKSPLIKPTPSPVFKVELEHKPTHFDVPHSPSRKRKLVNEEMVDAVKEKASSKELTDRNAEYGY
jgi:hypothetical protein